MGRLIFEGLAFIASSGLFFQQLGKNRAIVFLTGFLAMCAFSDLIYNYIGKSYQVVRWTGSLFDRPLADEIERLKTANAGLQSKNDDLLRQARDRPQGDAELRKLERDAEAERNRLNDIIKKQRADLDNKSDLIDAAHRDNRKLKSDLDSAIAERDQLRHSLAVTRTTAAPAPRGVPAVWSGPRCIEESRGGKCPDFFPKFGHDPPCLPGEKEKTMQNAIPAYPLPAQYAGRTWCVRDLK